MMLRVSDDQLLERYIGSFEKLDEMILDDFSGASSAAELFNGEIDIYDFKHWRPQKIQTPVSHLETLYAKLPAHLPPLFEQLLLTYRWAEVDLGTYRLLANPPGADLNGFFHQMSKDKGLWQALLPAGFLQFGKGPDLDYDPVCFDTKSRKQDGDCRIVKIDHEEILCNYRVKVVAELAPSSYQLVLETITRAESAPAV